MKVLVGISLDGCVELLERLETQVAETREELGLRGESDIDGMIHVELNGRLAHLEGEPAEVVITNDAMEQFRGDQIIVEISG